MKSLLIAVSLCCVAGFAQNSKGGSKTPPDIGTNVREPTIDFYDSMADYFRQSNRAVEAIAQKGVPAVEIPALLTIARKSSMSPNQVIEARKQGKSFEDIARTANVKLGGSGDFVTEANIRFLSEYHGQPAEDVRALRGKGASFIEINQQYRRVGMKPRTEKAASPGR